MKKTYIKPYTETVEISTEHQLLSGSDRTSITGQGELNSNTFEQYSKENDFDLFEDEEE